MLTYQSFIFSVLHGDIVMFFGKCSSTLKLHMYNAINYISMILSNFKAEISITFSVFAFKVHISTLLKALPLKLT